MITFHIEGFGEKSTDLLIDLIYLEVAAQKKKKGKINKVDVLVCGVIGGKKKYIEIEASTRNSFARACAILHSVAQSTPGPLVVRGKLLKRPTRIGPLTPPNVKKK